MTDKILYLPTEGTTGFWGLRDVPEEPEYCTDFGDVILVCESTFCKCKGMLKNHNAALESCKSNKVEIVNMNEHFQVFRHPDGTVITDASLNELAPGDIFDLPEGYQFKEEDQYWCVNEWVICSDEEAKKYLKEVPNMSFRKVLRLVKTETKAKYIEFDSLSVMSSDRGHKFITQPTFEWYRPD